MLRQRLTAANDDEDDNDYAARPPRWWGQRGFVICSESKTKDWLVPHKTGSIQFLCVHISRIIIGSVSLHLTWSNRQR